MLCRSIIHKEQWCGMPILWSCLHRDKYLHRTHGLEALLPRRAQCFVVAASTKTIKLFHCLHSSHTIHTHVKMLNQRFKTYRYVNVESPTSHIPNHELAHDQHPIPHFGVRNLVNTSLDYQRVHDGYAIHPTNLKPLYGLTISRLSDMNEPFTGTERNYCTTFQDLSRCMSTSVATCLRGSDTSTLPARVNMEQVACWGTDLTPRRRVHRKSYTNLASVRHIFHRPATRVRPLDHVQEQHIDDTTPLHEDFPQSQPPKARQEQDTNPAAQFLWGQNKSHCHRCPAQGWMVSNVPFQPPLQSYWVRDAAIRPHLLLLAVHDYSRVVQHERAV